jgi:catechol 2,3-dioxygenase-like lactoylglutathione lyase family enzyme
MSNAQFLSHHIALSVRDRLASQKFYGVLGFAPIFRRESNDDSLTITHLRHPTGLIIELFAYRSNASGPALSMAAGNDMPQVGLKHIAVRVEDLDAARATLASHGYTGWTPEQHGRTGLEFFFVQDPDGMWVEIVRDRRSLGEANPVIVRQP